MTFDEVVAEVESLSGQLVAVVIWGNEAGSRSVATLSGVLKRQGLGQGIPEIERAESVEASVFQVGDVPDNCLNLWRARFIRARRLKAPATLEIVTRDAVIVIRGSERWVD